MRAMHHLRPHFTAFVAAGALPFPLPGARALCRGGAARARRARARTRFPRLSRAPGDERDHPDEDSDGGPRNGGSNDPADSGVDWNAAWASFRGAGMVSDAPPGREPVPPRELARRRAAARVRATVQNAASRVPSRRVLFSDWRFWLAIIFALSLFSAYINSSVPTAAPPSLGGGAGVV